MVLVKHRKVKNKKKLIAADSPFSNPLMGINLDLESHTAAPDLFCNASHCVEVVPVKNCAISVTPFPIAKLVVPKPSNYVNPSVLYMD